MPAAGTMGAADLPFDSAAARRGELRGPTAAQVLYSPRESSVQLHTDPYALDAGTAFFISEVTDSSLVGRWSTGGLRISLLVRSGVPVAEQEAGYFCAWRR